MWLKEGFASFMEYMFVGANYPQYRIWLHFVNDELACGFNLDALRSSHPIEVSPFICIYELLHRYFQLLLTIDKLR